MRTCVFSPKSFFTLLSAELFVMGLVWFVAHIAAPFTKGSVLFPIAFLSAAFVVFYFRKKLVLDAIAQRDALQEIRKVVHYPNTWQLIQQVVLEKSFLRGAALLAPCAVIASLFALPYPLYISFTTFLVLFITLWMYGYTHLTARFRREHVLRSSPAFAQMIIDDPYWDTEFDIASRTGFNGDHAALRSALRAQYRRDRLRFLSFFIGRWLWKRNYPDAHYWHDKIHLHLSPRSMKIDILIDPPVADNTQPKPPFPTPYIPIGWLNLSDDVSAPQGLPKPQEPSPLDAGPMIGIKPRPGQRELGHVLFIAPTRAGKGLHAQTLLRSWNYGGIVVDIKGELLRKTGYYNQSVFWSPTGNGYRVDPFALCTDDLSISAIAYELMDPKQDREPIFSTRALSLVEAIIHLARYEQVPAASVFYYTLGTDIVSFLHYMRFHRCEKVRRAANNFFSDGEPRFMGSCIGFYNTRLKTFKDHTVASSLAGQDVSVDDILVGRKLLYITVPEGIWDAMRPITKAILQAYTARIIDEVDNRYNGKSPNPVLILIDEAGRIALQNLPDWSATLAGRDCTLVIYTQSVAQVKSGYEKDSSTVMANCNQIYYGGATDTDTFEQIERMSGKYTDTRYSYSEQGQRNLSYERTSAVDGGVMRRLPPHHVLAFLRYSPIQTLWLLRPYPPAYQAYDPQSRVSPPLTPYLPDKAYLLPLTQIPEQEQHDYRTRAAVLRLIQDADRQRRSLSMESGAHKRDLAQQPTQESADGASARPSIFRSAPVQRETAQTPQTLKTAFQKPIGERPSPDQTNGETSAVKDIEERVQVTRNMLQHLLGQQPSYDGSPTQGPASPTSSPSADHHPPTLYPNTPQPAATAAPTTHQPETQPSAHPSTDMRPSDMRPSDDKPVAQTRSDEDDLEQITRFLRKRRKT